MAAQSAAAEAMVLRVTLNTENKGDFFLGRTADGDFLVKPEDLKGMGFKNPVGALTSMDGELHISLRSMQGVSFAFQQRDLLLAITAEPQLLPARALEFGPRGRTQGVGSAETSAFVNYALSYSNGSAATAGQTSFSGEAGFRYADYLLRTDGTTVESSAGDNKFVRLMSSLTRDDPAKLQRTVIGDFFTPVREFGITTNMGGISVSKIYSLDPYLVRFPTQSITGNAALPSDLEVYVDGQQIRKEKIRPGEFELRDIHAYGGARSVQVVLRDAFGRVQQFDYSFYFSDQPLRQGLHEYSYNIGAFRRSYGIRSNRYGPAAYSLYHRYGFTNSLTLGARAEGTRELVNGGPTANVVLGAGGLLNFALSGSAMAGRRGAAGLLGYSYQSRRWSLGLSVRKDWGEYISLGDPPVLTNRKYEASANVGYNIDGLGSLSFSHSIFTTQRGANSSTPSASQPFVVSGSDNRRTTSLALAAPLSSGRALFSAGLSHVKDTAGSRNEIFARLMILLGKDYSTTSHVQYDKDSNSQQVQFIKNQPGGEGLGYVLSADRVSDTSQTGTGFRTTAQFNAPAAVLRADYNLRRDQGQGSHNYQLSVAGGLARVGGFTGFARPISGAFALVKVGELPDVTVRLNNQPVGKTDAQGKLFIPTLSSYMDSSISIAPESVPIQYALATMTKKVSPSARSGMLIEFAATKIQAITGKLHMLDGSGSKPLENFLVRYTVEGKTQSLQTGRGGEFYLENVPAGSYPAAVDVNGKPCDFEIAIPKSDEMFVELPTIVCRLRP